MRVLGFGTYDTSTQPRVGVILSGLRANGAEVRELNEPLGFSTAERVKMLHAPWLVYRLGLRLARRWAALVRGRITSPYRPDVIVVGYLGHFDVLLARVLFPRRTIVLDLLIFAADTARDRGTTGRGKLLLLSLLDRLAMLAASVIVVDTAEHRQLVPASLRRRAVVVPVGADPAWFAARPSEPRPDGPLRVIFFGLYTPLQGAVTIGEALAELGSQADIQVTMVGAGQEHDQARAAAAANPHVKWLDLVAPDELRRLVAASDVCLGIFGTGAKAGRVIPNKVYQGAAAGCAIITSDTAPQRQALGERAAVYVAAGNASALAGALLTLAADRAEVQRLGQAAGDLADERFTGSEVVIALWNSLHH